MASLHLAQEILDIVYPIGSVYISINTTDPSVYFGGEWERIFDGFLYCAGDSSINKQGFLKGNASTSDTVLTADQIPAHAHRLRIGDARFNLPAGKDNSFISTYAYNTGSFYYTSGSGVNKSWLSANTGSGKGHSHSIPYTGVSVWKRIA